MLRFHKTLDVITLFYKPNSPTCQKVYSILKKASADSCGNSNTTVSSRRDQFELEVTEQLPTRDQLRSIIEYVGLSKTQTVIKGAIDEADSYQKLLTNPETFQRPLTVDWALGRAVTGANESEILKMINLDKQSKNY